MKETTGVVLLNLGGPDTLKAVRPFLYNLFSDRDIIPLGPAFLQKPIAWIIALARSSKTTAAYRVIGGGSPVRRITESQADALQKALLESGPYRVFVGMRYWHPYIQDAVDRAFREGIRRIIALPLYPQYSRATTGTALKVFMESAKKYGMDYKSIQYWYDHPLYIEALVEKILQRLKNVQETDLLLFSAHSLPVSFIKQGDPYLKHTESTVEKVVRALTRRGFHIKHRISFQSRSGPVQWLEPSTEDTIRQAAKEGIKRIIVVPISFVSDHIETLYEIDILYKDLAGNLGVELLRTESLNTSALFISALKDLVLKNGKW